MRRILPALIALIAVAGCAVPTTQRCPGCTVLDIHRYALPALKKGTRRLFVLVPGLLGFGWEWQEPVRRLRASPDSDFVVFDWEPWGSLDRAARELRQVLESADASAPENVQEIVVVGHSAAGLVAARSLAGMAPPTRRLTVVTIGAPFAGMHICPCSEIDVVHAPLMISIGIWFHDWAAPPPGVRVLEYVTSYPSDPVMHPYNHHPAAPPDIGPAGAQRIEVDPKFDHNRVVDKVITDLLSAK